MGVCCSDDHVCKSFLLLCSNFVLIAKKETLYQDLERPSLSPWNRDEDEGFN